MLAEPDRTKKDQCNTMDNAPATLAGLQRPDMEDLDESSDILEWVAAFTGSEDFSEELHDFVTAHAADFVGVQLDAGAMEHRLEWHEVYRQFLSVSEAKIERFLASRGFSAGEFHHRCVEELARQEREHRHSRMSFFVQLLLACTEYEQFLAMMVRAANPELECLADLELAASNMLETAAVAALRIEDREALRIEAGATLEWVAKARRGGAGAITEREVEARAQEFEESCNPILDARIEEQEQFRRK